MAVKGGDEGGSQQLSCTKNSRCLALAFRKRLHSQTAGWSKQTAKADADHSTKDNKACRIRPPMAHNKPCSPHSKKYECQPKSSNSAFGLGNLGKNKSR